MATYVLIKNFLCTFSRYFLIGFVVGVSIAFNVLCIHKFSHFYIILDWLGLFKNVVGEVSNFDILPYGLTCSVDDLTMQYVLTYEFHILYFLLHLKKHTSFQRPSVLVV